jgi:hypothetical protein
LLVSNDVFAPGVTVKIEDSCAHGTDLINIEILNGEIVKMDPPTVFVQRGGG